MAKHKPMRFTLVLVSTPTEIIKVEEFLEGINDRLRLGENRYNKLLVATTEAVNNGIIHGNKRDPKKKVTLTFEVNNAALTVHVRDEGAGVDPTALPNPLAEENLLRENGRGVFLMRTLMDSVEFERLPGGSEVVMKMDLRN
jgi:serine/threonine-protein kinase RsbW